MSISTRYGNDVQTGQHFQEWSYESLTGHLKPDKPGDFSVSFGSTKQSETWRAAGRISRFERAKDGRRKRPERMLRYEQL